MKFWAGQGFSLACSQVTEVALPLTGVLCRLERMRAVTIAGGPPGFTFRYLRDNAVKIAASARAHRATESALAQVRQTGSATAILPETDARVPW
ncbi:hypothetical protein ACIBHX_38355 [Nonomuraea sp. NPDC050536]|uniref:hypothetical protein n=1 Tax=Nonomuraea sp. NPDC050536 TaxID=3364366 RepID=UPI0037C689E4